MILSAACIALLGAAPHTASAKTEKVISQQRMTKQYRLLLQIGPPESMGMNMGSQVCSMPGMSMSGSKGMKTCNHHVELHVFNRKTGQPQHGLHVGISLRNMHSKSTIIVPVTTMGTGKDFHYGNNIYAPAGTYFVSVTVNRNPIHFNPVRLT